MVRKKKSKTCIGFGEFKGKCENKTENNPYYCIRCDRLRIEHISDKFNEIAKAYKNE
jgi:hypothetical protein